jgi:hypothetical protein
MYGWDDNIEVDLREKWLGGVDGTHVAVDMEHWWTPVILIMNLRIP